MKPASGMFTEEDKKIIADAVTQAEEKTSGEIVPVAATCSGRYDRAEDIFGLITAIVILSIVWGLSHCIGSADGWSPDKSGGLRLCVTIVTVVIGFIAGATASAYIPVLRLPFITKREMEDEVERSSAEAFHRFRLRKTSGATGILIYVSLYERMVRILGDDAINSKVSQTDWNEIRDIIINAMKRDQPAEGFKTAVIKCGELLSENFPIQQGDKNELSNELRIID